MTRPPLALAPPVSPSWPHGSFSSPTRPLEMLRRSPPSAPASRKVHVLPPPGCSDHSPSSCHAQHPSAFSPAGPGLPALRHLRFSSGFFSLFSFLPKQFSASRGPVQPVHADCQVGFVLQGPGFVRLPILPSPPTTIPYFCYVLRVRDSSGTRSQPRSCICRLYHQRLASFPLSRPVVGCVNGSPWLATIDAAGMSGAALRFSLGSCKF